MATYLPWYFEYVDHLIHYSYTSSTGGQAYTYWSKNCLIQITVILNFGPLKSICIGLPFQVDGNKYTQIRERKCQVMLHAAIVPMSVHKPSGSMLLCGAEGTRLSFWWFFTGPHMSMWNITLRHPCLYIVGIYGNLTHFSLSCQYLQTKLYILESKSFIIIPFKSKISLHFDDEYTKGILWIKYMQHIVPTNKVRIQTPLVNEYIRIVSTAYIISPDQCTITLLMSNICKSMERQWTMCSDAFITFKTNVLQTIRLCQISTSLCQKFHIYDHSQGQNVQASHVWFITAPINFVIEILFINVTLPRLQMFRIQVMDWNATRLLVLCTLIGSNAGQKLTSSTNM